MTKLSKISEHLFPKKNYPFKRDSSKNEFPGFIHHSPEVNISSYPVTRVTGLFLLSRAEIFKLGCFVQKYSDLGVSCRNICQVPFHVTQSEKCILEKVTQMVHYIMEQKAKQCIR